MTTRTWIALLIAFELTWLAYVALLLPVVATMITAAPQSEIRAHTYRLLPIMPAVMAVSVLACACASYDVFRRKISGGALWIIGFVFLGVIVLPIYFATTVLHSAKTTPSSP